MSDDALGWMPATCTRPTVRQPLRLAEMDDFSTSVRAVSRVDQSRVEEPRVRQELDLSPVVAARAAP